MNLVVAHMEAKNLPRWTHPVNLVVAHMEAKNLPRWTRPVNLVGAHMEAKNLPRWTHPVNLVVAHMEAKNLPRWTRPVNLVVAHMEAKNLPRWTRSVKFNNRLVLALLDTGCTKSMVHPCCVQVSDYLPWKIPYRQPVQQKLTFLQPESHCKLKEGHRVGGRRIPPFLCRHVARARRFPFQEVAEEALEEESSMKPEINSPSEETKEETRIQTSLVTTRAQLDRQHLQDLQEPKEQEVDKPVIHSVDSNSPDGEGEQEEDEPVIHSVDSDSPDGEGEQEEDEPVIHSVDSDSPDGEGEQEEDEPVIHSVDSNSPDGEGEQEEDEPVIHSVDSDSPDGEGEQEEDEPVIHSVDSDSPDGEGEQEEDEPVIYSVDSDSPDGEGEEENILNQLDEVDPSREAEPEPVEVAVFDTITPEYLKKLQKDDPSLQKIREKTKTQGAPYFWKDDILMRQPYRTNGKELVIIAKAARMKVLQLAHNSPLEGHFGRARTLEAIRTRVDWPGIATDVRKMCSSCSTCQKASPALLTKAPCILCLSFQRVANGYFWSVKKKLSGDKYVLVVVVDYTTKWPEAIPLKNMTLETVVIDLTSRMGVSEEILQ